MIARVLVGGVWLAGLLYLVVANPDLSPGAAAAVALGSVAIAMYCAVSRTGT